MTLPFYKLQASGNDFILIDNRNPNRQAKSFPYKKVARDYCRRKFSVGADGLLIIEFSVKALFKMRIFNPDGSEAEMCGNGARCSALWADYVKIFKGQRSLKFETKAGIIEAEVRSQKFNTKWGGGQRPNQDENDRSG
ncbi:MAG: hypothetical protein ABH858_05785 [Candidatus Omnitrophota bacterium]